MANTIDYSKFNAEFGGQEALKELKQAQENEFKPIPDGEYVCGLEKLELGTTKDGKKPMIKGVFRIKEGAMKKQCIFINQVFTRGFPQHQGLKFLRSLNVFDASEIDFNGDFFDFSNLLLDIVEESDAAKMTFLVRTKKDGDYTRVEVVETYEN